MTQSRVPSPTETMQPGPRPGTVEEAMEASQT